MRSRAAVTALACTIVLALGWAGCDDQPTSPPEAEETEAQAATEDSDSADLEAKIERLINAIFPSGQARSDANDTFSAIKSSLAQGNTDEAQSRMFDFVDGLLEKARAGELQDPKGERIGPETAREGAAKLTRLYFEFVGLEAPPITAKALQESGAADVVSPDQGAKVKTGDGKGGVDIPPGRLEEPALVTVERREDPQSVEESPIPQDFELAPHPPFYDVETTTQPTDDGVLVGICVPESGPLAPLSHLQDDLRVVRRPDGEGQPDFLPTANADFVDCGSDEIAVAGKTTGFSTFGGGTSPDALQASAGIFSSCAVREDDQAFCWGFGGDGQLGDGTRTSSKVPVSVDQTVDGGISLVEVDAGGQGFTCGRTSGGDAYCWGHDVWGNLGDGGAEETSSVPVAVDQPVSFDRLTVGLSHACGLASGGQAYCWGDNDFGQLGDGTTVQRNSPAAVDQSVDGGITFVDLSAGFRFTCGLTSGGQTYCWGNDLYGRMGNGPDGDSLTPVRVDQSVDGGVVFSSITAGLFHTCGLTSGDISYCWGLTWRGQLGNGVAAFTRQQTPTAVDQSVDGGVSFVQVAAGRQHSCWLTSGGQTYCSGRNLYGGLGIGTTDDKFVPTAVDQSVDGGVSFDQISAGNWFTCGVTSNTGEVYCWGQNDDGELGDGTTTDRHVPTRVGS